MHFYFSITVVLAIFDIQPIFIKLPHTVNFHWVYTLFIYFFNYYFYFFTFQAILNKSGAPFIDIFPTYLH